MNRLALALVAGAGLLAGSAAAATTTMTYDLGAPGDGTVLAGGAAVPWIAQGALPAGSILREVSIDATLEVNSGGSWASDLNVLVDGLLQIGSDGGSPDWANGQNEAVGSTVIDTKTAGVDFPATIDLHTAGVFLKNTWSDATWTGTVTIKYDTPDVAAITSFGLPDNPADIHETAITWSVPFGTNVSTLAPVFTMSAGATCDHVSGTAYDFSSTVHYVVTSADGQTVKDHTVTVLIDPQWPWINVNFDTGTRTGLVGPAGGAGTAWNQCLGTTTLGPAGLTADGLLDANGNGSTVGFTCNASNVFPWGAPALTMLTSAAFSFASDPVILVINGLKPGRKYVLYLASYHPYELGGRSLFSTSNQTTTIGTQVSDTGGPDGKSYRWFRGVNYVRFDNIVPDAANRITITMTADVASGRRAYLSGFQLIEDPLAPTCPYAAWIAGIDFSAFTNPDLGLDGDPDGDMFTNMDEFLMGLNPTVADRRSGVLTVDFWSGIPGFTVPELIASNKFYHEADTVTFKPVSDLKFTGPYIGTRSRGYLTPAVSGDYTFWISASTSAELWLSSDLSKGKYAKQRIAEIGTDLGDGLGIAADELNLWDRFASQQSATIHLEAGQAYYVEIDHKDGSPANSNVSIAWACNGGARQVVPDALVSSYVRTTDDPYDIFLPAWWASKYGLDPADNGAIDPVRQGERGDFDGDGIINRIEYLLGTNPADSDTNHNGLSDGDEYNALGTNPLAANSITDTFVNQVALAGYIDASTAWSMTSGGLIANSFRGAVTWNFSVPSNGFWLLRLNAELMGSTFGNEEVPVVVSVDGRMVERLRVRFGMSRLGMFQALTPWLAAGNHQVTILIDNMLARRTVRIVSLKVYAPADASALLAQANRVLPHAGTSRTSPAFLEGYARDVGGTTVKGVPVANGTGDGHWFANVPLAAVSGSQPYLVHFEQGWETTGALAWQATNVMDAETLTIRQGDAMLVGAWSADPGMTSAAITSSSGEAWNLTGTQTFVLPFANAGTFIITATVQNGAGATNGNSHNNKPPKHAVTARLTVKVVAAPAFPLGIVDALDTGIRTLDVPAAPEVALETQQDLCRLIVTRNGTQDVTMAVMPRQPVAFGIAGRLFPGGPILAVQQINVVGVSDALQNDLTSVAASGIAGYKIYNAPLTVTNLPEGGRVDVNIFRAGVMFLNGSMQKSIYPGDLTNGWVNLQFLFPIGASGGYCHSLDVYGRNGDYLGSR
ncbi:MAG: PA14 domain-containing protein [Verrucomicrobiota bacterium]